MWRLVIGGTPSDASSACSKGQFALLVSMQKKKREARENLTTKIRSPIASLEPTQGGELLCGSLYLH
jgi:hypothetical protein